MIMRQDDANPRALRGDGWSAVYGGRRIATFHLHGRWHVYLDDFLQHDVVFASGQHAIAWLIQRVDKVVPARLD
jgi:hypothetical protein